MDYQNIFNSKNSGGGVFILYKSSTITKANYIEARGMDSEDFFDGEGGGGAIYVHDLCWEKTFYNNQNGLPIVIKSNAELNDQGNDNRNSDDFGKLEY